MTKTIFSEKTVKLMIKKGSYYLFIMNGGKVRGKGQRYATKKFNR